MTRTLDEKWRAEMVRMRMRGNATAQEKKERGWLKRGKEGLQLVTLHQPGGPGGCMIHRSALSSPAEYTYTA